ncbi:hypothetical protein GCM10007385_19630 [Tateyamaria omphalii]|uniref:hypothetical protein n=1 Tax=Tateyamaria omphalii TaxID=299262 RepID=UPI001677F68C|nr:hypothetical protein [Tateyamaria omphalii]GGX51131.1 hypothetical protein GCM10007385_19630 [Tateyamaria omphalii]
MASTSGPALANTFEARPPEFTLRGYIGTTDRVTDRGNDTVATELLIGPILEINGRYEWRNDAGDRIIVTPFLTTKLFPDDSDVDELRLGVFGEYRFNSSMFERTQYRLQAGLETSNDFSNERFRRYSLRASVNIRDEQRRSSTFSLRYRYRDQNEENTFDGFDQHEYLGSLRYSWSPNIDGLELIAVTPYFDIRDADAAKFSYNEFGVRFQARYRLADDLTLTGRAKAFVRDYKDSFSNAFDFERSDDRWALEVELRKTTRNGGALFGAIGWEDNQSNVPVRDFSGVTVRVGYEITLP